MASLLAGALPLALAGVVPWREVVATRDGADPLLQASILQQALRHSPFESTFWSAPWFWPEPWTMAFMDPLIGPSWWLRPLRWCTGGALLGASGAALAYNLVFVSTLSGSFLATGWLSRKLGLGTLAALVAASVATLGPWSAGQWHHLNQIPAPWLPLALAALLVLRDDRRPVAAAGALLLVFVAQLGWSLYASVALGFAGLSFLALCAPRSKRSWGALSVAALLGVGLLFVYSIPFREAAHEIEGYGRGAAHVAALQARPFDLWKAPQAHLLPWPSHDPSRPVLYIGFLWASLAVAGAWSARRSAAWRGIAALGVLGLGLAFGRSLLIPFVDAELPLPFAWLQDQIWPLQAIRGTSRLAGPFALAAALLGARALQDVVAMTPRVRRVAAVVACVALIELLPGPSPKVRVAPDEAESELIARLRDTPENTVWMPWPAPCRERDESTLDARVMLWALWSERPVAGGSSGFLPPSIAALRAQCCEGAIAACANPAQSHGVERVVWKEDDRWRCEPWADLPSPAPEG